MSSKAKIEFNGKKVEFPVVKGSEGEHAIDVKALRQQLGLITLTQDLKIQGHARVRLLF